MTAGTKVTIAVIVLFAVVLGVYYSFGGPGAGLTRFDAMPPAEQQDATAAIGTGSAAIPMAPQTAVRRPQPQAGILSNSVQQAAAGDTQSATAARNPFAALATDALRAPPKRQPQPARQQRWVMGSTSQADVPPAPVRDSMAAPRTPAARQSFAEYVVGDGDSMWTIAQEVLGDGTRWSEIAGANPTVDPDRLRIGQKLRVPAAETEVKVRLNRPAEISRRPTAGTTVTAGTYHAIKSGETLSTIAERYYGSAAAWNRIYAANKAIIGSDPDRLVVGRRLLIPAAD